MVWWKSCCERECVFSTLTSVNNGNKNLKWFSGECLDLKVKRVLVPLDKHMLELFAVVLLLSFMFSLHSVCCWHPSVIWRNRWCFSCANISARTDSGPRWPAGCKPPNHHPPTCCHIWDLLYTNTKWLILVQEGNRPGPSVSSTGINVPIYPAHVSPDPALTSPLLPCPHILILFGMCCQAADSVNTAPGNSDRKPLKLCGKLDAITVCTPICSDNWISVRELVLCHSPLFCSCC